MVSNIWKKSNKINKDNTIDFWNRLFESVKLIHRYASRAIFSLRFFFRLFLDSVSRFCWESPFLASSSWLFIKFSTCSMSSSGTGRDSMISITWSDSSSLTWDSCKSSSQSTSTGILINRPSVVSAVAVASSLWLSKICWMES